MKISLLFLLALAGSIQLFAGNSNSTQILFKGKVIDEFTGQPVGCTMEFREPDGHKFKITANSKDGSFQSIVSTNKKYEILFINYDIVRKFEALEIADSGKYYEYSRIFNVKRMEQGKSLFDLDAFQLNAAILGDQYKKQLEQLKDIMIFNRGVKFEIVVNAKDTYKQTPIPVVTKPEPKKKGKKTPPPPVDNTPKFNEPDAAQIKALVDERLKAINELTTGWQRFRDRFSVTADYASGAPDYGNVSVRIVVKELKNAFEQ